MNYKYLVTLIIPVYNVEYYLHSCLDSVVNQTIDKEKLQVVLVDDSSSDSSPEICNEYCNNFNFFEYYRILNNGPANARNFAIEKAQGKYIAFLDSDDKLTPNTLECLCSFFDEHYEETDVVTYKIIPVEKGVRKKAHFRYKYLTETGIYDLNDEKNIYISQTTMNIVVKNRFKNNIKFELIQQHEDQKYNIDNLRSKMKIGYVADCEYLYERNPNSIVRNFNSSIFDETIQMWIDIFDSYIPNVPGYIQALYCNDLLWKTREDILFPYHLEDEEYKNGVDKIISLLKYVDDDVLLNHPDNGEMNKYYFLDLKYNGNINALFDNGIKINADDKTISTLDNIQININKLNIHGEKIEICGTVISPVLKYVEKPELYLCINSDYIKLNLNESSHSYNQAKLKNSVAYGFRYVTDLKEKNKMFFKLLINDSVVETELDFDEWIAFNNELGRNTYFQNNYKFKNNKNKISITKANKTNEIKYNINRLFYYLKHNRKTFVARMLYHLLPSKRIWLYHDCKGYSKDNGYYQFIHDFYKNDGVDRYYVINGSIDTYKDWFDEKQLKSVIVLRSIKHKLLYLKAEKIITAYIEKVNYVPFFDDVLPDYLDLITNETIYLQHGILHAHLPWKYSYDRLNITKEVCSSSYEINNFSKNYCFPKSALIESKMPRYDHFSETEPTGNKILFAPSWRRYLISFSPDGSPVEKKEKFTASDYFKKTYEFLHSDELLKLLEENDYYLDVKLHPIFACYASCFDIESDRIKIISDKTIQSEYKIFITDYSSFVFDFVYLNRAIIYFMPDYKEFKAGLNDYRELDIPFENGFGEFTQDKEELIKSIEKIINNDSKPLDEYAQRNSDFFINHEKNCCDKIYDAIIDNNYE